MNTYRRPLIFMLMLAPFVQECFEFVLPALSHAVDVLSDRKNQVKQTHAAMQGEPHGHHHGHHEHHHHGDKHHQVSN